MSCSEYRCKVHYPLKSFLEGYHEPPTISQDHIKAISSAVFHHSDSVILTAAMQLHAVHYEYDLWSSEADLHSQCQSRLDCNAPNSTSPAFICVFV